MSSKILNDDVYGFMSQLSNIFLPNFIVLVFFAPEKLQNERMQKLINENLIQFDFSNNTKKLSYIARGNILTALLKHLAFIFIF